ncbi:MAG: ATP-binding protein [Mucilaginibacter sp.]
MKLIRNILPLLFIAIAMNVNAQHSLKKLWSTDTVLNIPESVLPAKGVLYVSLIDGGAWTRDGKGGVGKLTKTGKIISQNWVTGLNAPKGLGINGDILYVADLDEVVEISISKGKIVRKLAIKDAENLNDITVDEKGVVYVSDTKKNCIFKVQNNKATLYLSSLKSANGLKAVGDKLYILTGDGMYVSESGKKPVKICALEHGGDGIEPTGNGDFLVTEWLGYLYYVKKDGSKQLIFDTHNSNNRTADIGYDASARTVYVPTFLGKSVVAYRVE